MKKTLDWRSETIVNIYDEVSLWSAPFGKTLLENIPMHSIKTVLDLGFGTGFPLIELAQRFSNKTQIIGVEIWQQAIKRTKEKIGQLEISNIQILEQSAKDLALPENCIDLVCSNLGVNNFEDKEAVYQKIYQVLKPSGSFCFTTNDLGTFQELFKLFDVVFDELNLDKSAFNNYIAHRSTATKTTAEIEKYGFKKVKYTKDETYLRFADAEAVFDHSLIRIAFLESWEKFIPAESLAPFLSSVKRLVSDIIIAKGEFRMTVPILYFQFSKDSVERT